jgi:hypothetical protein
MDLLAKYLYKWGEYLGFRTVINTYIPVLAFDMTLHKMLPKKYWFLSENMSVPSGVTKGRSRSHPASLSPFPKTKSLKPGKSLNNIEPVIQEPPDTSQQGDQWWKDMMGR